MNVKLTNVGSRLGYGQFIGVLHHQIFCRRADRCACRVLPGMSEAGKSRHERYPDVISIGSGASLVVHPAVLHLPQVKDALRLGWLVREPSDDPAVPFNPPEPPTPPKRKRKASGKEE